MIKLAKHILRPFEGWGIGWLRKYEGDIFFRTTIHIVALQAALIILSIGFFALALRLVSSQISSIFGVSPSVLVFCVSVLVALVAGIILSRVALRPARGALQSQKLFISNIAHELRTPLAVIRTLTEVELLEPDMPPAFTKTLQAILEETHRASGVINNLVSLNRLLKPQSIEQQVVDLSAIVERVAARSGRIAFERGIEVIISRAHNNWVVGNPVALEQLVINLTNNALQYTPKNHRGRVTLSIRPDDSGMTAFSVADTGIGIAKEDIDHVLEPFYRGDKSRARNIKDVGSGLGLAIVSEIVRAHNGDIRVNSVQGKGTTITVLLPTAVPPAA